MAPKDVMPVGSAGVDTVFLDEVPDDLFEGDAAGWEVEAGEGSLTGVVLRGGVDMQMGAWISEPTVLVKVVGEHRTRVVEVGSSLVAERGSGRFQAYRVVDHLQRDLNIQVHSVAERRRLTAIRRRGHAMADDQPVRACPHIAKFGRHHDLIDLANTVQEGLSSPTATASRWARQ